MKREEALGLAAQCWCAEATEHKTMDEVLASAFADKLMEIMATMSVKDAREVIASAFQRDPDFREVYVANVAMLLHDRYGITDHETRNKAGDDIVRLIFET